MIDELKELALFRTYSAAMKERVNLLQAKLEATPEYAALVESKELLKGYEAKVDLITSAIKVNSLSGVTEKIKGMTKEQRTVAFAEFKKTLQNGLSLRVNHSLEYSEQDAIKWCEVNAKTALKTVLDKKPFESLAEATEIAFVKKIDVPTITIASDLSEYLE